MNGGIMDKVEKAREMFRRLEGCGSVNAAEVAKRTFLVQDRLARN